LLSCLSKCSFEEFAWLCNWSFAGRGHPEGFGVLGGVSAERFLTERWRIHVRHVEAVLFPDFSIVEIADLGRL
jgi:hypothetical protein